ncbi:sigma-70 family RNA polymerase sigma factor [Sulfobacillus harzensis]|uniref:Sigma-70 family RNA polymerase sigma factor n=1 Tax=Sulfobacillus harzensis TaxID=2729629 RepID=A0A7Y0L598_9FIRM|nr:sigma-70 family RNA polymerase sigma factor [Sulfobacillus harzensis]
MAERRQVVESWLVQYKDRVFRLAFTLLGNKEAAEDAAQEALYHIARWCLEHPDFEITAPWVWQVTRNAVRDLARRTPPAAVPLDDTLLGGQAADFGEDRIDVARALVQLSDADREVLVFFYFLDLSTREVAQVLGITATAARIRLSRARKRFKAAYQEARGDVQGEGEGEG